MKQVAAEEPPADSEWQSILVKKPFALRLRTGKSETKFRFEAGDISHITAGTMRAFLPVQGWEG
jgi:hypothetical protein